MGLETIKYSIIPGKMLQGEYLCVGKPGIIPCSLCYIWENYW